jgi:hypothetical protein
VTDSNGKSPVPEGGLREEFEYNRFERCWLRDLLLSEPSFEIALGRVQAEAFAASDRETFEKALIDAFIVMDREVARPDHDPWIHLQSAGTAVSILRTSRSRHRCGLHVHAEPGHVAGEITL